MKTRIRTLIATAALCPSTQVFAMDLGNGLEFTGYIRAGVVAEHQTDDGGVNKYALGSGAELFRLGNEGDTYAELGLKKTFHFDSGVTWSAAFTATYWNGLANFRGLTSDGMYVTKEAYVATSGYAFSPSTIFWAGKRYVEREDVHIGHRREQHSDWHRGQTRGERVSQPTAFQPDGRQAGRYTNQCRFLRYPGGTGRPTARGG
jgi:maltoporin